MSDHFTSLDSAVLAACVAAAVTYVPAGTADATGAPESGDVHERTRRAIVQETLKLYAALGSAVAHLSHG